MKFEDSKYSKRFAYKKEVFPFETLYLTKYFIVSELNEGVHVDYTIAGEIISRCSKYVHKGDKISYIANRYKSLDEAINWVINLDEITKVTNQS